MILRTPQETFRLGEVSTMPRSEGGIPILSAYHNTLLRHLDPEVIQRLSLRERDLPLRKTIELPGQPITRLVFVEAGVASMTVAFHDGSQVEVGMFGFESVSGIPALMGVHKSLNAVYMQLPGRGYSCSIELAREEFQRGAQFHMLALHYVQAQLTLALQSAACNAKHDMQQRLARWLLICADRAHTTELPLSQEFLSQMLGASRPTVSIVANELRDRGLIDYTRGVIRICNMAALEQQACECYGVVKRYLDNYIEFDTGMGVIPNVPAPKPPYASAPR